MSSRKPAENMAEERSKQNMFGWITAGVTVLWFATTIVQLSALEPDRGSAQALRDFDEDLALIATALKVISLGILIPIALFLFEMLRRRDVNVPNYIKQLGIAGPVLMAIFAVLGYFAQKHTFDEFLELPAVQQTNDKADDLNEEAIIRLQFVGSLVAGLVMAAWIAVVCASAVHVGLMPKFLAYFGYAVAFMTLPLIAALAGSALFVGWIASIALLMLDQWPGGRPPSWDSGKAEPILY